MAGLSPGGGDAYRDKRQETDRSDTYVTTFFCERKIVYLLYPVL
jgi:hypothetical protein